MKRQAITLAAGVGKSTYHIPSCKLYTENDEELLRNIYGENYTRY